MNLCQRCFSSAMKPKFGTLGESKGFWCTKCGYADNGEATRKPCMGVVFTSVHSTAHTALQLDDEARRCGIERFSGETDSSLLARLMNKYSFGFRGGTGA